MCQLSLFRVISIFAILSGLYLNVNAQTDSTKYSNDLIGFAHITAGTLPTYYLKIEDLVVKTDTSFTKNLNPKWVKSIKIIKDSKYKKLFNSPMIESSILIKIKRRYATQTKEMLKL